MNNLGLIFVAFCGVILLGTLIVFLYLLQDWSLFEQSGRACKIVGNPKWNRYCRKKFGLHKTNKCNTGCRTSGTPIGNVCCSSECCRKL